MSGEPVRITLLSSLGYLIVGASVLIQLFWLAFFFYVHSLSPDQGGFAQMALVGFVLYGSLIVIPGTLIAIVRAILEFIARERSELGWSFVLHVIAAVLPAVFVALTITLERYWYTGAA